MGNNQDNFQLHRFTISENIGKSFTGGGYFFDSHCTYHVARLKNVPVCIRICRIRKQKFYL